MTLLQKNQLMKINMSVWITENSNILSYDDIIANERYLLGVFSRVLCSGHNQLVTNDTTR